MLSKTYFAGSSYLSVLNPNTFQQHEIEPSSLNLTASNSSTVAASSFDFERLDFGMDINASILPNSATVFSQLSNSPLSLNDFTGYGFLPSDINLSLMPQSHPGSLMVQCQPLNKPFFFETAKPPPKRSNVLLRERSKKSIPQFAMKYLKNANDTLKNQCGSDLIDILTILSEHKPVETVEWLLSSSMLKLKLQNHFGENQNVYLEPCKISTIAALVQKDDADISDGAYKRFFHNLFRSKPVALLPSFDFLATQREISNQLIITSFNFRTLSDIEGIELDIEPLLKLFALHAILYTDYDAAKPLLLKHTYDGRAFRNYGFSNSVIASFSPLSFKFEHQSLHNVATHFCALEPESEEVVQAVIQSWNKQNISQLTSISINTPTNTTVSIPITILHVYDLKGLWAFLNCKVEDAHKLVCMACTCRMYHTMCVF